MPALSFSVFREKILSGEKTQTIRVLRKRPFQVGDKLYLYWHQRSKDCEKLGEVICTEAFRIWFVVGWKYIGIFVRVERGDYAPLSRQEMDYLARRDGFTDVEEMVAWFRKTYRYINDLKFQVIRWPETQGLPRKEAS